MFVVSPSATSWISVSPESHFSIQNIPFGLLERSGATTLATVIGEQVVDLTELKSHGYLSEEKYGSLEGFETFTPESLSELRKKLFNLFESTNSTLSRDLDAIRDALLPLAVSTLKLPIKPPAFVDFYSGIHHASNVGKMFRPDQPPLLPNYRHIPVGYNGRASSVIASGTPVRRPLGQTKHSDQDLPTYGPTNELDFEVELGFYAGRSSEMGERVPISEARNYLLGFVLVNDWSARDFQRWEYQPLGPFLAKSFATSVSPWIVLQDALEPFVVKACIQDPEPLQHLQTKDPVRYDIHLEVTLNSNSSQVSKMLAETNSRHLYWSFDQQLAHQSSNGTPLQFGDLYASGTISGPEEGSFGSLLELSWRGSRPVVVSESGETRTYLEDGDSVTISGYCQGPGFRVGFGEVEGTILPSILD